MNYWKEAVRTWFFVIPHNIYFIGIKDAISDFIDASKYFYSFSRNIALILGAIFCWFIPFYTIPFLVVIRKAEERKWKKSDWRVKSNEGWDGND